MAQGKKPGFLDRIRREGRDRFATGGTHREPLSYAKGNLPQNEPKNAGVWNTCPVLDETGRPLEETDKAPR